MASRYLELLITIRPTTYVAPFDGNVARKFEKEVSEELHAESLAFGRVLARKLFLEVYTVDNLLKKLRQRYAEEAGLSEYATWREIDTVLLQHKEGG